MDQWQGLLAQCARSMGFDREPRRAAYALGGVGLFWAVGLLGGLPRILHVVSSPMTALVLLYLMLVVVALSFVVAAAAVLHLGRQAAGRRRR